LILKKFKKLDKLIDNLNQSQYGLACFLYTKNKKEKQLFTDKIRYGRTWINESLKYWNSYLPIGGFRNSGYGTETGLEGIKNYLVNKSIIIKE
jgi:acyl-CoA reductase-like NAD-dependent aldehyde dehydrogenase